MPHKSSIIDTSEKSGYLRKVSQVEGPLDAAAGGPATAGRRGRRIGGRCGEGDSVVKDNAEARRTCLAAGRRRGSRRSLARSAGSQASGGEFCARLMRKVST